MAKKRGRCPSLIGSTHGAPRIEKAKGKRTCKRCDGNISKGDSCVITPIPGSMGRRVYCCSCIREVIAQSRKDLEVFETQLNNISFALKLQQTAPI